MNRILLADAEHLPLPDKSVDLVFTSPPYCDARTYGISAQRDCDEWVEWMLRCVKEMVRVSRGLVLVNCAGVTRKGCYWPACEGLLYRWWKDGGQCWRPAFWKRTGIPGSGGPQWLRAEIEYVLAFKGDGTLPFADNTANGHIPKWAPGGEMSYRQSNGTRRNAWGQSVNQSVPCRKADGSRDIAPRINRPLSVALSDAEAPDYVPPKLANPGNLIQGIPTGGGHLGWKAAHENEAPFPVKLAEWFIRSFCPPAGVVCDPFGGSGTVMHAAINLGRQYVVSDIRPSQVALMKLRLLELTTTKS